MEVPSNISLEFLDLTDVDEYEREHVLNTLHSIQGPTQFPWFIGEKKPTGEKRKHVAPESTQFQPTVPIINPQTGLVEQPAIINAPQQYFPMPQYFPPAPAPFVPYPPSTEYTPYPSFPMKAPVYYGVPPAQPIFITHPQPTDMPGYFPEATQNPPVSETKKPQSPLSADTPPFTPKNQQEVKVVEEQPSVEPPKSAWGANKTWASLFNAKGTGGSEINGLGKGFPELVKETNNNEACPIKNPKRNSFVDPDCYRMGEFLMNYTLDGRTISLQPRGLINKSNYCYINSILQALIACPPLYNLLNGLADSITSNATRKPTPVIDGMCKFVREYKHLPANMRVNNRGTGGGKKDAKKEQGTSINTDVPFEASWIYKILRDLQTGLVEGRQEDAEEFLGCLLNQLSDEMLELIKLVEDESGGGGEKKVVAAVQEEEGDMWQVMGTKNKGTILRKTEFERTPITDIFGGALKLRIHRTGGQVTENTQPFLTLQLNIEKSQSVKEALEALTTKHELEGLTSSKTNEQVEAWQQVMLDELPVVLVLHLKCFDYQLSGCAKIVKALEFPVDLKIDGKLISSKTANAKEKQYKLFAVVYHDGKEATKGHYVTDAFHVGYSSWLRYDDASVKPVQEEHVLNPQGTRVPYLLFYRRCDTIRSR
ncbi:ubiquitin carboxyl-terminal hydrolase 10 [Anthonomus grandis grandis]|uniref:ubiquitin carboxyl-terminal hydrolase 10 n=1 Tax=Anthonomus grandis grandis TaxID=2921223 RepID=UPI002165AD6F|nr:ubiquitin carboxyl-terminal hydrolase 10 [Anthonomus grandis grandis]